MVKQGKSDKKWSRKKRKREEKQEKDSFFALDFPKEICYYICMLKSVTWDICAQKRFWCVSESDYLRSNEEENS